MDRTMESFQICRFKLMVEKVGLCYFIQTNYDSMIKAVYSLNVCRKYVDIIKGEKLSSIYLAIFPVIYWSSRSYSWIGWDWGKAGWNNLYLARYYNHFIVEHEYLV